MIQLPQTSGVYKITHLETGRTYVGSTRNFRDRWRTHIRKANTNRNTPLLQKDWGDSWALAFEFSIIEEVPDVGSLLSREQFYIDTLNPYYNRSPTAGSPLGVKHTVETRTHASQIRLGGKLSEEHKQAIGTGARAALADPEVRAKISKASRGRQVSPETGKKLGIIFAQDFLVTEPSGKSYRITNLSEFCRNNDLSQGHMSSVSLGKKPHHKGWLCQKISDEK